MFNLLKESLTTDDELEQFAAIEQQLDAASHRRQVALQEETQRIGGKSRSNEGQQGSRQRYR